MKTAKLLLIIMIIGLIFLVGCKQGYDYNRPPAQATGAVVGGGCGVAGVPLDVDKLDELGEVEFAFSV